MSAARTALWYAPLGLLWVLFHNWTVDAILTFLAGGLGLCALLFSGMRSEARTARALAKRQETMRTLIRAAELKFDDPRRLIDLAAAAVPVFADWCLVDVLDAEGAVKRVAIESAHPARAEDAQLLGQVDMNHPDRQRRFRQVLERGAPIYHRNLTDEAASAVCADEAERRLVLRLHLRSAIAVPVSAGGRGVGLITFLMGASGRNFRPEDLDFAVELAERLGSALEHIQLVRQSLAADQGRKEAEAARQSQEQLYRLLADHARDLVLLLNEDGTVQYASPSCLPLLGYEPAELIGVTHLGRELVHPEDQPEVRLSWEAVRRGQEAPFVPFRAIRKDGSSCWLEPVISLVPTCAGGQTQVQVVLRDITDRKLVEEQLAHQAFHDGLTGLPNRSLFLNRLQHALSRGERRQEQVAVLFMDLDGFKIVNDSLGHAAGDHLLIELGRRLQQSIRAEDTIARMGGDEFAILLESVADAAGAVMVAERAADALRAPVMIGERQVTVTASVGIALAPPAAYAEPGALLRDADAAMYRAKAQASRGYKLFNPSMNREDLDRLELEADLRHAAQRGELIAYYQPIVSLRDGSVQGVEALVRWQHPRRGLLGPDQFIPLAEETGLVVQVGRWVLHEACRQLKEWQERYHLPGSFYVSVNLSVRQFQIPNIADRIRGHLEATGLAAHCLQLELTESMAMQETPGKIETLRAIKALGVRLAVDDFGTGYSSFSYLKQFPVDVLKIDRSFVNGLDRTDEAILSAIATVGWALGLELVAEGIETADQATRLLAMGCRSGQGFYYYRPLPATGLAPLLWRAEAGTAD